LCGLGFCSELQNLVGSAQYAYRRSAAELVSQGGSQKRDGGSGEPIPSGSLLRTLPGGAWALVPSCFQSGITAQAFNAIAHALDISPRTVAKHLEHIYRKLDVNSRTSAVFAALTDRP